jgi:hypothetical protein
VAVAPDFLCCRQLFHYRGFEFRLGVLAGSNLCSVPRFAAGLNFLARFQAHRVGLRTRSVFEAVVRPWSMSAGRATIFCLLGDSSARAPTASLPALRLGVRATGLGLASRTESCSPALYRLVPASVLVPCVLSGQGRVAQVLCCSLHVGLVVFLLFWLHSLSASICPACRLPLACPVAPPTQAHPGFDPTVPSSIFTSLRTVSFPVVLLLLVHLLLFLSRQI